MAAISIIMPAYNAEAHLPAALARLIPLASGAVELLLVDDGSTDSSAALCAAAAESRPHVVFVALPENRGVSLARKAAVAVASGDYIWLIDTDDTVMPDGAAAMLAAARATDADVVVAHADFVYADGSRRPVSSPEPGVLTGDAASRAVLTGDITGHLWNKLFRRETLLGADFAPARVHSDLALVASALARAVRVTVIDDLVYEYRIRAGSIVTSKRSRAESLEVVGASVAASMASRGITSGDADYDYFGARYITLSALKDLALSGETIDSARLRRLRADLSMRAFRSILRRRDVRRLALACAAKVSVRAHRALLRVAER